MNDDLESEVAQEPEASDNSAVIADILKAAGVVPEEEEPAEEVVKEESPKDNPPDETSKPYTIEELVDMGKSETFDKLNTSRIPAELQPVYKSLNAMATRRQQSLAEKERELEVRLAHLQGTNAQASPAPAPMEQRVYTDPVGVLQEIQHRLTGVNSKLYEAQRTEDIFEVQKLLVEKDSLKDRYLSVQNVVNGANQEWTHVYNTIPDFKEKAPKLIEYTNELLGEHKFTQDEISWLTNPLITGKLATKLVYLINNVYEVKNKHSESVRATEEKLKKVKPSSAVSPGSGETTVPKNDLKSLRNRAKETQDDMDIAAYIGAMTAKGK